MPQPCKKDKNSIRQPGTWGIKPPWFSFQQSKLPILHRPRNHWTLVIWHEASFQTPRWTISPTQNTRTMNKHVWLFLIHPGTATVFGPPISNEKDLPQLLDIVRPLAKSATSVSSLTDLFRWNRFKVALPWHDRLSYYQTMAWTINTIGFGVIQQSVYGQNFKCVQ